jgi:hypothetical protein
LVVVGTCTLIDLARPKGGASLARVALGAVAVAMIALMVYHALGMALTAVAIFAAVQHRTQSASWGLLAAGMPDAAYGAMGSQAWLVGSALLGTYLIDRGQRMAGVVALTLSLWFGLRGGVFRFGGLPWTLYLGVLPFALWAFVIHLRAPRERLSIWDVQFAASLPFGAFYPFTIVLATMALAAAGDDRPGALRAKVRAAVPMAVALAYLGLHS